MSVWYIWFVSYSAWWRLPSVQDGPPPCHGVPAEPKSEDPSQGSHWARTLNRIWSAVLQEHPVKQTRCVILCPCLLLGVPLLDPEIVSRRGEVVMLAVLSLECPRPRGGCTMRYIQRLFIPSSGNRELFSYYTLDCGFTYSSWRFVAWGFPSGPNTWRLLWSLTATACGTGLEWASDIGMLCSKSSLYYVLRHRVLGLERPVSQLSFLAFGILGSSSWVIKACRLFVFSCSPAQSRELLP